MSFLDEIKKNSSEKFSLIRMSAARIIDLVSLGSDLYGANVDLNVFKCVVSGDDQSLVETPSIDGEFSFNGLTGDIVVFSSSPISSAVIFHYIYLTTIKNRAIGKDPIYPTVDLVEWRGVVLSEPTFNQSLDNINYGILSINTSSIEIISNGEFDYLLSKKDSASNCRFDVWYCCNGVENIQHAFYGVSVDCSQNGFKLSIKTKDALEQLKSTCYMGDSIEECYINSSTYPNRDINKDGTPIPFLLGRISEFKNKASQGGYFLDPDFLREASCSPYSPTISTTTNREWVTHRSLYGGGIIGSYSFSILISGEYVFDILNSTDAKRFYNDDKFKCGSAYFKVSNVSGQYVTATILTGTPPSSPSLVTLLTIPYVVIIGGGIIGEVECYPSRDYTVTSANTSGGNLVFKIVFNNGFDTFSDGPLDPSKHQVKFRASSQPINHDDTVSIITRSALIDSDFTPTGVSSEVSMMIPEFSSGSFENNIDYVEKICRSNAGYLYQKTNGKFDYKVFSSPSSPIQITKDDYLKNTLSIAENSQDMVSELVINPDCIFGFENNYTRVESEEIRSLIGINKKREFNTVNVSTVPSLEVVAQNLFKTVSYSFKTKAIGYDWTIGKSINIKNKDLIVTGIDKSISGLTITAVDTFTP